MIYDEIKNIERYRGISKNLDTAIDFLEKTDLNSLPLGKQRFWEIRYSLMLWKRRQRLRTS